MPNLTLPLVYSWPGYIISARHTVRISEATHVDLGVVGKSRERLVQRLVHLFWSAFEEASTA